MQVSNLKLLCSCVSVSAAWTNPRQRAPCLKMQPAIGCLYLSCWSVAHHHHYHLALDYAPSLICFCVLLAVSAVCMHPVGGHFREVGGSELRGAVHNCSNQHNTHHCRYGHTQQATHNVSTKREANTLISSPYLFIFLVYRRLSQKW